jgi:hypothetical protein
VLCCQVCRLLESGFEFVTAAQMLCGVSKDFTKLGGETVTKLVHLMRRGKEHLNVWVAAASHLATPARAQTHSTCGLCAANAAQRLASTCCCCCCCCFVVSCVAEPPVQGGVQYWIQQQHDTLLLLLLLLLCRVCCRAGCSRWCPSSQASNCCCCCCC